MEELGWFIADKRWLWDTYQAHQNLQRVDEEPESGSSWQCRMGEEEIMSISWKKRGETSPMKTVRQWWRLPRETVQFPSLEVDKTGHPWATQPDPRAVMLWIGDWTRDWMWSLPTWIVLWFWIYSAGYYQEHPRAPRIISYITYILQIHFNVFSLLCYQYLVHCLLYTDIIPALQTCHQGEKNVRCTF